MKDLLSLTLSLCMCLLHLCANNPLRTVPYPGQSDVIYLNPAPLVVPHSLKQSDYLQFNLSPDKDFNHPQTILSKPVPWCVFNPHQTLTTGTWYWRFRSVSKTGEEMPWSETYTFTVDAQTPQFVTPPFGTLLKNLPQKGLRIYCFLEANMPEARKTVRSHPEFEILIDEGRNALVMNYTNDTKPYSRITQIAEDCDKLYAAYQLLQNDIYAEKMVQNVRCLLAVKPDSKVISNDFNAGELVYTLACTYESCGDRFNSEERAQIETLIMDVIGKYYHSRFVGREENMYFDEHFWQFTFRRFLQGALVMYDKSPLAKEYLEYSYELWTSRAPASGFNRTGSWHNGANYFSANAVSLAYVAILFTHLTGMDFFQHPWYRNAGLGIAYNWQPGSQSSGFGDGHEKTNSKPLRIRSAFADILARNTGDMYAAWYSANNSRYMTEFETRLYRMACGKPRPTNCELPTNAPKAVWFKDCGDVVANTHLENIKKNLSLSFHCSPFGSGNHTHANQNAFNLHYGGEAIYRSVGHYMSYSDPHNLLSYRHTRAHNTLLIDGIGQPFTQCANGAIVRMFNGEHISYALGDASDAYCGVSDVNYWVKAFAKHKIEQSPENGFGITPLTKYRRHIFLLHPNIVVIYDELEASKKVRWDWLLHSPVKFDINPASSTLVTEHKDKHFKSVAQLFSEQTCGIKQTDQYAVAPDTKGAQRGEDFTNPWTLTASFGPSKANRILTVIRIEADGMKAVPVNREGKTLVCGDWTIEAELNPKHAASLLIKNSRNKAMFGFGKKTLTIDGEAYRCRDANASVIHDVIDGSWKTEETDDCPIQRMKHW